MTLRVPLGRFPELRVNPASWGTAEGGGKGRDQGPTREAAHSVSGHQDHSSPRGA